MSISQVQLSNTFNQFRQSFNDAANAINYLDTTLLTGTLTVNTSATFSGTTQSSSTGTGSAVVAGGLGVAKNVYVGGNTVISDTTDSTSSTTGSLRTAGGAGIVKNLYVGGDVQITGNLTVVGTNTAFSTTQVNVDDNMLQIANNNTANTVDIGFFGQYSDGSGNLHSGFFRDASDGFWKLFKGYSVEPSSTINVSASGYEHANLLVNTISAQTSLILGTTTFTSSTIATPGKAIAMAIVFGG